jgi:prepilin-type processing-associated H-X9-DG protein
MLELADTFRWLSIYVWDRTARSNPAEGTDWFQYSAADLQTVGCETVTVSYTPREGDIPENSDVGVAMMNAYPEIQLPDSYPRLKEGVERFFITDINNPAGGAQAQSTIAMMWDAWGATFELGSGTVENHTIKMNHVPGGSNVLYMDGHVSFVRLNSDYPVTTYSGFDRDLSDNLNPDRQIMVTVGRSGGNG